MCPYTNDTQANTHSDNVVKVEMETKTLKELLHREHMKMLLSRTNRSSHKKTVWLRDERATVAASGKGLEMQMHYR
jgi:hypothetical protein